MNQKKQTLQHLNRNVKCFKKQPENAWNSTMERKHSYVKKNPTNQNYYNQRDLTLRVNSMQMLCKWIARDCVRFHSKNYRLPTKKYQKVDFSTRMFNWRFNCRIMKLKAHQWWWYRKKNSANLNINTLMAQSKEIEKYSKPMAVLAVLSRCSWILSCWASMEILFSCLPGSTSEDTMLF